MKLSEHALAECRGALEVATRLHIRSEFLDVIEEILRPSFEKVLDNADGPAHWKRDREMMIFQSSCVGMLATLVAKWDDIGAAEVSQDELVLAFYVVKAGCDVRMEGSLQKEMVTIYCSQVKNVPPAAIDFWKATLASKKPHRDQ